MYDTFIKVWWNMKVNLIQHDLTPSSGSATVHKNPQYFRERNFAGVCEKNNDRGYSVNNSGSLPVKSGAAAITFQGGLGAKISRSSTFNSFLKLTHEHNIATSAFISLILAGALRPATIMALPGKKDKEDKIYASGHSMASGVIGFIASVILTSPLDTAIKSYNKRFKDLYKDPEKNAKKIADLPSKAMKKLYEDLKNLNAKDADEALIQLKQKEIKALELAMKNIPDWIIAIPRSIVTIALIPPILKYVFGVEKKKKPAPEVKPEVQTPENNMNNIIAMNEKENSAFAMMKGGLK